MRLSWKTCLRAGITVVLVWLVISYWPRVVDFIGQALGAGMPLLVGAGIGYVANILMCFYERLYFPKAKARGLIKSRRPVCLLAAYLTVAVVIAFVFSSVLPELWRCITMLLEKLPDALRDGYDWLEEHYGVDQLLAAMGLGSFDDFDWRSYINRAVSLVYTGVGGVMGAAFSVVTSTVSFTISLVLGLAFSAYLLAGKESIGKTVHRITRVYCGEKMEKKLFYVLRAFDDSFHHFIVSQCLEAVILGSLCILGMMIFQFPYAIMIGVLVGFTAFIPIAGAYFAGAVGAFMIFTVDPLKAVLFVVFLVCLQQLENNLIYPRVVGSSINIPPIWVLAAITIGGGMLGVFGMLLGVPTAAAIFRLVDGDMNAREQGRSIFDEAVAEPTQDDKTIGA